MIFPMTKCNACPLADRVETCTAQARNHPAICGYVADGNERWIAKVLGTPPAASPTPTRPGFFAKLVAGGKAVIQHAVAGFPEAAEETAQARLAICRACPDLDPEKMTCNRCGCQMDVKVYWSEQRCPVQKW